MAGSCRTSSQNGGSRLYGRYNLPNRNRTAIYFDRRKVVAYIWLGLSAGTTRSDRCRTPEHESPEAKPTGNMDEHHGPPHREESFAATSARMLELLRAEAVKLCAEEEARWSELESRIDDNLQTVEAKIVQQQEALRRSVPTSMRRPLNSHVFRRTSATNSENWPSIFKRCRTV